MQPIETWWRSLYRELAHDFFALRESDRYRFMREIHERAQAWRATLTRREPEAGTKHYLLGDVRTAYVESACVSTAHSPPRARDQIAQVWRQLSVSNSFYSPTTVPYSRQRKVIVLASLAEKHDGEQWPCRSFNRTIENIH